MELSQQQDIIMSAILNQLRSEMKKIIFQQEVERGMTNSIKLSSAQLEQLNKLLNETNEPTLSFRLIDVLFISQFSSVTPLQGLVS